MSRGEVMSKRTIKSLYRERLISNNVPAKIIKQWLESFEGHLTSVGECDRFSNQEEFEDGFYESEFSRDWFREFAKDLPVIHSTERPRPVDSRFRQSLPPKAD